MKTQTCCDVPVPHHDADCFLFIPKKQNREEEMSGGEKVGFTTLLQLISVGVYKEVKVMESDKPSESDNELAKFLVAQGFRDGDVFELTWSFKKKETTEK